MHLQCKGHGFDPWAEMAAHFSTLAWETPWTEEPAGYSAH